MDMDHNKQRTVPEALSRQRRTRTIFTNDSIARMEEEFNSNRYPDIHNREAMAAEIGVSEARVQVWFQNRRARVNKRKISSAASQYNFRVTEQSRESQPETHATEPPQKLRKLCHEEYSEIRDNQSSPSPMAGTQSSISPPCVSQSGYQLPYAFQQLPSVYTNPYFRFPYLNMPLTYTKPVERCERMLPQFAVPTLEGWFPFPGIAYPGMNMFEPFADRTIRPDQDNVTADDVVNRLFRFSDKNKSTDSEVTKATSPYQLLVPRRRTSGFTINDFRYAEDRNVESPLPQSPTNIDKDGREMSDSGHEFSGNAADDSGFANDSSSESCA